MQYKLLIPSTNKHTSLKNKNPTNMPGLFSRKKEPKVCEALLPAIGTRPPNQEPPQIDRALEFQNEKTRTFYVQNSGWKGRQAKILDEDESTLLYEIDLRCRRPNMTFRTANDNETVGTIRFSPMTRVIQADTAHGTISVKSKNWKCCDLPTRRRPLTGGR